MQSPRAPIPALALLHQVESCYGKLQRDVIDRGSFTSAADLKRKILSDGSATSSAIWYALFNLLDKDRRCMVFRRPRRCRN